MLPFLWLALQAGAARVDVSPTRLPVIVNCGFNERLAHKIVSPLYAKALVLSNTPADALALVVVDSCMMPRELIDRAKAQAARRTGIREDRMLISATHTHFAPAAMACLGSDAQADYVDFLTERIAAAIAQAHRAQAPAELGAAAVNDEAHTFNRRFVYRSDRLLTDPFGQRNVHANMHPGYQNPDTLGPSGPTDPGLAVLAVRHKDGRPLAVFANYSMHYFASEPISSDAFGLFTDEFAKGIGAPAGFVAMLSQGTSGDLMWMDYAKPKRDVTLAAYTAGLVDSALTAWRAIRYQGGAVKLHMAETKLTLDRRLPSPERLAWARSTVASFSGRKPKTQPEIYAREQIFLQDEPRRELKLQAIRIGDLALTAMPNEVFALTGLKLKAQSPLALTLNVSLANGADGYIPPPEQHALGGYTTWPARTAGLEVQAEPKIVGALLGLLERVTGEPRRAIATVHGSAARAVLHSRPDAFWALDDMQGDAAKAAVGPDGRYEGLRALYVDGVDGRSVLFAGGRFVPPSLPTAPDYTWEAWHWDGWHDPSWRHKAMVCRAGRATLYLDGVAVGAPADCTAARGFVLPTRWEGKLDSLAYFGRALEAPELFGMPMSSRRGRVSAGKSRQFRVFVSSTFADMEPERDELVKRVFPMLRRMCEERGVTWAEVDLRWGITDEARAEGQVLPLCLAEIDECRPFFIGLLGHRYGWIPDELPAGLTEDFPWLNARLGDSVTALEFAHGALHQPRAGGRAFFYFRDPRASVGWQEQDPGRKAKLEALKDEVRASGWPVREGFTSPRELGEWVLRDFQALLDELYPANERDADRVRGSQSLHAERKRRVFLSRPSLSAALDEYVDGASPLPLVLVGDSGCGKSALLSNWVASRRARSSGETVVLYSVGAEGSGATWMSMLRYVVSELSLSLDLPVGIVPEEPKAFPAYFGRFLRTAAADRRIVVVLDAVNQLEASDEALGLAWLPRDLPAGVRIVLSTLDSPVLAVLFKRGCAVLPVPLLAVAERRELIRAYLAEYSKTLSEGRVERIADCEQTANPLFLTTLLNELRVFGRHHELDRRIGWYLEATSPSDLFAKVIQRWEEDFESDEAEDLVGDTLSRLWAAREGLSEAELLDSFESRPPGYLWSPLYLAMGDAVANQGGLLRFAHPSFRQTVEECYLPTAAHQRAAHRVLVEYFVRLPGGSVRQVDELPWQLWQAGLWEVLYAVLSDLEFVEQLMGRGLTEVFRLWAALEANSDYRMEQAYADRAGESKTRLAFLAGTLLMNFGRSDAARAILQQTVDRLRREGRLDLLGFALHTLGKSVSHPEHKLAILREQAEVARACGDELLLAGAMERQARVLHEMGKAEEAAACWDAAESLYGQTADGPQVESMILGVQVAKAESKGEDIVDLLRRQIRQAVTEPARDSLLAEMRKLVDLLLARDELDEASEVARELASRARSLGLRGTAAAAFEHQADIALRRGIHEEVVRWNREAEKVYREEQDQWSLARVLGNQAVGCRNIGDLDGALRLLQAQEAICLQLNDDRALLRVLGNKAVLLKDQGDVEAALAQYQQHAAKARAMGEGQELAISLGNQSVILESRGDLAGATALAAEKLELCEAAGDGAGAAHARMALGRLARNSAQGAAARRHFEEAVKGYRELGRWSSLAEALERLVENLDPVSDEDRILKARDEQMELCLKRNDPRGVAITLGRKARILLDRGDLDGAQAELANAERLYRIIEDKSGLAACFGNQAEIERLRGNVQAALAFHQAEEALCRELGKQKGLRVSLMSQADLRLAQSKYREAIQLIQEAESVSRAAGDRYGVAGAVGARAALQANLGDLAEALRLYGQAETMYRQLGAREDVAACLGNRANMLRRMGNLEAALPLHLEEERLFREANRPAALAVALNGQGLLRLQEGNLVEALRLFEEGERICRQHGFLNGLAPHVGNQAAVFEAFGDLQKALVCRQEEERICRQLENPYGVALSLARQAQIVANQSRQSALPLAEEALAIAREHNCLHRIPDLEALVRTLRRPS